jgi:hypothetical protein
LFEFGWLFGYIARQQRPLKKLPRFPLSCTVSLLWR